VCVGHEHSSPGTKSQGHRPRSKVNVVMHRSDFDPQSMTVFLVEILYVKGHRGVYPPTGHGAFPPKMAGWVRPNF